MGKSQEAGVGPEGRGRAVTQACRGHPRVSGTWRGGRTEMESDRLSVTDEGRGGQDPRERALRRSGVARLSVTRGRQDWGSGGTESCKSIMQSLKTLAIFKCSGLTTDLHSSAWLGSLLRLTVGQD